MGVREELLCYDLPLEFKRAKTFRIMGKLTSVVKTDSFNRAPYCLL